VTLSVGAFWLPKAGNTVAEYEDAFEFSVAARCFAVADGATDSAFAGRWARSLVRAFANSPPPRPWGAHAVLEPWLEPLQGAWRDSIAWDRLPWYGLEKAREGAFSSLIGLAFVDGGSLCKPVAADRPPTTELRWHAVAVGDSCLFHVRDDTLLAAFPLNCAAQFGNRPLLLSSNPANNRRVWEEVWLAEGDCQSEDTFFLATDALAQWFLSQHEAGVKPWVTLGDLKAEADFALFIAQLRQQQVIRNDDTTLLSVRLVGHASPSSQEGNGKRTCIMQEGEHTL
jgi:hypothetical protein